jgi:hypothetical protein
MRARALFTIVALAPATLAAQTPVSRSAPDGVILQFVRFADIFGEQLVVAFDSIPADKYDFKPTPIQQTIGYIAQHLETANYSLCERLGGPKHPRTAKDSLADTVKARWPKDTLVRRLEESLRFCDDAIERLPRLDSPAIAATLIGFETDLAEHYSQLAVYMRLLGLVPSSALPPKTRTAIDLPESAFAPYAGTYQIATGTEIEVTVRDHALYARSSLGGNALRLWPESATNFFTKEADVQIQFTRDASGTVTGMVVHQFRRDRPARKIK